MIRKGRSYTIREKFCKRKTFTVTNNIEILKNFKKYELTDELEKLKELRKEKL